MENSIPICRVCMQRSPEFVGFDMPLQNENEEDTSITYLDFFYECTRIEVEPYEGGTQCFCLPCGDELRSFYKFIKIAEMTDRILKENCCVKKKNCIKNDSTFEIIEWKPQSEDDHIPKENFLKENSNEESTDSNEELPESQSEDLNLNGQLGKREGFTNQLLVNLRVEIFSDKNLKINETMKNERTHLPPTTYKTGPVECAFCHDMLKNRKRLDKHLIEKHQRRNHPCEICGKMVIRMRDHLLIHYRERNEMSRPKIDCPICLRKISQQTISRHIRDVHKREIRDKKCLHCLQTFADAHKLRVHMEKGHDSKKILKCPLCSRIFSNQISLNNHLRTHTCLDRYSKEKVFSCNKCPKFFRAKRLLDAHVNVHTAQADENVCDFERFQQRSFDGGSSLSTVGKSR